MLPAVADAQLPALARGLNEIQEIVGDYFAPAQGGRFASSKVAEVLAWLQQRGCPGIGQSSWGPTGFALIDSEVRAHALAREAESRFDRAVVRLQVVRPRNYGGVVEQYRHADTLHATVVC
ncbi:MAG: hypothetical protein M3329_08620 [Pseudomonadota bacterium]|nr:hypothetical protein [Pseudomonadota bacterium]